jgi:phosphohistidine phosphatase
MSGISSYIQVLYLVRHGDAKSALEDPERGLSDRGVQSVKRLADWAAETGLRVNEIRHSGKRRAEQTAEILAESLRPTTPTRAQTGLAPNDDVHPVAQAMVAEPRNLMLVGHLPFLARLVGQLVLGSADQIIVGFDPATLVRLVRDNEGWLIDVVHQPNLHG